MEEKLTVLQLEPGKIYKREGYETKYMLSETGNLLDNDPCDDFYKLSSIKYNDVLKPIFTEIKREIDWTKVPRMTKVQVRDYEDKEWINRYFCRKDEFNFMATTHKDDQYTGYYAGGTPWNYYRIHPSVEISDEWYKEV